MIWISLIRVRSLKSRYGFITLLLGDSKTEEWKVNKELLDVILLKLNLPEQSQVRDKHKLYKM
jgi:hypothetical protein